MNLKNIIFSLFLVFIFAFQCAAILAENRIESNLNSFSKNDTKTYANFCTGFYLMHERRWEEAIESFKKSLQLNPHAAKIHNYLATCYFQLNKKDKALFHIEKVAQLKPNDFGIHYTLGSIYENEDSKEKAISEYERASCCVMENIDKVFVADTLHRLANLYLKSGSLEKASDTYKKILDSKLTKEPFKIHYKLGQIYFERKMIKDAISEFVKAKDYNSNLETISFNLALCYEELEDYDNAIAELKSFIANHSETWLIHISLSNIYEQVEQHEMAESEREKAFGILRNNVYNGSKNLREYIVLSQLYQKKGKNKRAVKTLKNAISNVINGGNEALKETHFLLANIYYEMNDDKNVVNELTNVLQIDPDCHQANNFLGYFYIERGKNLDEALNLIKKALSIEPENGAYIDSLGWAYYKLADKDDNEKIMLALQKLIEASKYAEDPEIMGHIADVYYSLGLWGKAQKQWENALKLWEKVTNEFPPHLMHETAREFKIIKTIRRRLKKLRGLRLVESSVELLESGKRVVNNRVQ